MKIPQKCLTFEPKLCFTKFKSLNRSELHQKSKFVLVFCSFFPKKSEFGAKVQFSELVRHLIHTYVHQSPLNFGKCVMADFIQVLVYKSEKNCIGIYI